MLPDGGYVVMGGSFIDPVEDVDAAYERPFTPDWNADDPQIPKSPWWLASNDWVECGSSAILEETFTPNMPGRIHPVVRLKRYRT